MDTPSLIISTTPLLFLCILLVLMHFRRTQHLSTGLNNDCAPRPSRGGRRTVVLLSPEESEFPNFSFTYLIVGLALLGYSIPQNINDVFHCQGRMISFYACFIINGQHIDNVITKYHIINRLHFVSDHEYLVSVHRYHQCVPCHMPPTGT